MKQAGEPFDPYYQWLGIPPDQQPPNHYRLLGIQLFEENREVIQNAADRQMAHLRSFQSGPRGRFSQRLLNEIAAAKLCLLTADKKAAYDASLRAAGMIDPLATGAGTSPPPQRVEPPSDPPPADPALSSLFVQAARASTLKPSRPAKPRVSAAPWTRGAITLTLLATGIVIAYFVLHVVWDGDAGPRLVLQWTDDERQGAELMISGRACDLQRDPVAVRPGVLEFALTPGTHWVRITREGYQPIEQRFEAQGTGRIELAVRFVPESSTANLHLQWPAEERIGLVLELDGRTLDLDTDPVSRTPHELRFQLPTGTHLARVLRGGDVVWERRFDLAANKRAILSVKPSGRPEPPVPSAAGPRPDADEPARNRLHLLWPAEQREGARLWIDQIEYDLSAADAPDEDELHLSLDPDQHDPGGEHVLRISREGFEDFQQAIELRGAATQVAIALVPAAPALPSDTEQAALRELFRSVYREYPEYRRWSEASDDHAKQLALSGLLARLVLEAEKKPVASGEQWVAYDESIRLALDHQQFAQAYQTLQRIPPGTVYSQAERSALRAEIWNRATAASLSDGVLSYFKLRRVAEGPFDEVEQGAVVQRLLSAVTADSGFREAEARVEELAGEHVLTRTVALRARGAIYLQSAKGAAATPAGAVELSERIVRLVGEMLASSDEHNWAEARGLVDTVSTLRVAALKDPRSGPEVRTRLSKLADEAKELRDGVLLSQRVAEARQAISAGAGTAEHQRLVGFWQLQVGQFTEALPHLRATGDEALARVAVPLPATARELVDLATVVDQEARKAGYTKRYADALRAYASHLRQLAFDKDDGTLAPPQHDDLQSQDEHPVPAEPAAWLVTKGRWHHVLDLVSVEDLRNHCQQSAKGSWTIQDDGTLIANLATRAQVELPFDFGPSYGVRLLCGASPGGEVNIHLPIGDRSVLLTLDSASTRMSGLQLIDGTPLGQPANPTTLTRERFSFRRDVPVRVDIEVVYTAADAQSPRLRKQSGGEDWVVVSVAVDGRPFCSAALAASRLSVPEPSRLSRDVFGISTRTRATFAALQVTRK